MSVTDPDQMSAEEVAGYLRVAERTIFDWAQAGEIPCTKHGSSWFFRRPEIDRWLTERFHRRPPTRKTHSGEVELSTLLRPCMIHFFAQPQSKAEVLEKLCALMAGAPQIRDAHALRESIFRREELMSTGLGRGLAVPHVRLESVSDVAVAAAICPGGIADYESLDEEPVRLVFMIAAAPAQHEVHIKLVAQLASRLKKRLPRERLIQAGTTEEVLLALAAGE